MAKNPSDYIQNFDILLYRVSSGDSLSRVLKRYYPGIGNSALEGLVEQVVADNPVIKNPDRIYPDQLIRLKVPEQYCSAPTPFNPLFTVRTDNQGWILELERDWSKRNREERDFMSSLIPFALGAGSAKLSMFDTTFSSNAPLLREMINNYEGFKAGSKSKGQYDYQRHKLVSKFKANLGPTNLVVNGTQPPTELLRISRTKGTIPTAPIENQVRRMTRAASVARSGGVVLSVAGLGIACHQIANAPSQNDKNEILVESAGGLVGGIFYGLGASAVLLFMATPIGWVAGLAIGIGGALTGYASGRAARNLYNLSGKKIDFAGLSRIDQLCSPAIRTGSTQIPQLSNSTLSVL